MARMLPHVSIWLSYSPRYINPVLLWYWCSIASMRSGICQFAGVLADCTLAETGAKEELLQQALVAQLAHSELLEGVQMPEPDEPSARHALPANEPRIVLNNGVVSYNDRPILNNLSWRVNPANTGKLSGQMARENRRY